MIIIKASRKGKGKSQTPEGKNKMLETYEYTHSNNRKAETIEQSAERFFKANPQLKGEE